MNDLYRLTTREKFLCVLSLVAIMSGIWLHITDLLTEEKKFYKEKISSSIESINVNSSTRNKSLVGDGTPLNFPQNAGDILKLIEGSLQDFSTIKLLSVDVSKSQGVVIKLKANLDIAATYLEAFNQANPGFQWNYIRYRPLNDNSIVEFSSKLPNNKGDL